MIKFDKISFQQYCADRKKRSTVAVSEESLEKEYQGIIMPRRGTMYSAGYDFRTPFDFEIAPGESLVVPTGIRVFLEPDLWMGVYIRSSLGIKHGVRLLNSVGVIDADYSGADNEGHIMVGLRNTGDHPVAVKAGEAFAQGIIQRYYVTDDDEPVEAKRTGGFGSTNK